MSSSVQFVCYTCIHFIHYFRTIENEIPQPYTDIKYRMAKDEIEEEEGAGIRQQPLKQ